MLGNTDVADQGDRARQARQPTVARETEDCPYRRLVEAMSEGAALLDDDGLIVYASQRLATLLGLPLEWLLGRPFSDLLDEPQRSPFVARLTTASAGGQHEHALLLLDGGTLPVRLGLSATEEPDGLLRCVTVTDLSARKAQQQQMDRLNAELQVARETTPGFTAAAAHDLRSPLQSIVGFSDVLTQSWATLSEQDRQKFVAIIERQARTLSGVIDNVITMSHIEGGELNGRPERIGLREAIDRCLETGGESTSGVSVDCSPDLVICADPLHLGRMLDNYLQNALAYGQPPVGIEAARIGDLVEVRVLDQGPGVPAEFVSRLFGKFTRADTPTTKARKGLGLGLAIVRGLARANGGQARYEPNAPHGACFMLELPVGDGPRG